MGKLVANMTEEEHEHSKAQRRLRYQQNKQKELDYAKEYYQKYSPNHKEERAEYNKAYRATEKGTKKHRISAWKGRGVICEDWDLLYEKYINTTNCENCDVVLVEGRVGNNAKHLDHDHKTNLFRAILCSTCNVNRRNEIL